MSQLIQTFHCVFDDFLERPIIIKKTMKIDVSTQTEDGQEPTTNIKSEINNKTSDDEIPQIIESVETKPVDDLLQAKQHQEPQHPTIKIEKIEIISAATTSTATAIAIAATDQVERQHDQDNGLLWDASEA